MLLLQKGWAILIYYCHFVIIGSAIPVLQTISPCQQYRKNLIPAVTITFMQKMGAATNQEFVPKSHKILIFNVTTI